jgi:hypothetical protein
VNIPIIAPIKKPNINPFQYFSFFIIFILVVREESNLLRAYDL